MGGLALQVGVFRDLVPQIEPRDQRKNNSPILVGTSSIHLWQGLLLPPGP